MKWLRFGARWSRMSVMTIGFLLILLFGVIDYATGPEISFLIFYLIPIAAVSWLAGVAAGAVASVAATVTFLIVILLEEHGFSHPSIPYWNALVRLGFFLIVAVSLSSLRGARERREELSQFIVHDLRSPLSNVMTGLSILREDEDRTLDDQQKRFVEMCMVSCTRMLTLINSLLDLSRLERGRMPLRRENVSAAELCTAAVNQVRLWARQKDVRLEIEVPENAIIHVDEDVTVRVMVNLLSNAVKHAPEGSVVTMRTESYDDAYVAFSVQDEGAGIPEEWAEKVFDAYTQVDAGRSVTAAGSGLGLTFSRRAVQAQGGKIWMASAPEAGTTVTFTMPRAKDMEPASVQAARKARA